MNRIGVAGEGGRESPAARLGDAIGHPRPKDAASAIRVEKSPRRMRSAPRREGPAAGRASRRRALGSGAPIRRSADPELPPRPCDASARLFRVPTADGGGILRSLRLHCAPGPEAGRGVAAPAGGACAALRSPGPFQPTHGRMRGEAAESPPAGPSRAAARKRGGRPRLSVARPWCGAPIRRTADSESPLPLRRAVAALSGSDRRRGCDLARSAPAGRAGCAEGSDVARSTRGAMVREGGRFAAAGCGEGIRMGGSF